LAAGNAFAVEFDYYAYGGNNADGIAVTLSDAAVSPRAGGYGGSLGYAQRWGVAGFAGGWLGVGIDEFGNFRNDEEGRGDGGEPTGRISQSVAVRGSGNGTTGYLLHGESGALNPDVANSSGHRYRVTVDHRDNLHAWTAVERDTSGTGGGYVSVLPAYDAKAQPGQASVPEKWLLSFTGSTGSATNNHEIDDLRICAALPFEPFSLPPDHIEIRHDGAACVNEAETVTVVACANASCGTAYTQAPVKVKLRTDLGRFANGSQEMEVTTGADGRATLQLSHNTPATATLSVLSTEPATAYAFTCLNSSGSGANKTSCKLKIDHCTADYTCVEPSFGGADLRDGKLFTKLVGKAFTLDVAAINADGSVRTDLVATDPPGQSRSLTVGLVDMSGVAGACDAEIPFVSQDVALVAADQGKKSLTGYDSDRARKVVRCQVKDNATGLTACVGDSFTIRPQGFTVTTTVANADTDDGSSTSAGPRLKAGADPFDIVVTALPGYDGSPKVEKANIEAHAGAIGAGLLTGTMELAAADPADGKTSGSDFLYDEVGYFRLLFSGTDANQKGVVDRDFTAIDGTDDCVADSTANELNSDGTAGTDDDHKYGCVIGNFDDAAKNTWFGRFVPDHFEKTSGTITEAHGGFTYMSQPFGVAYTVSARNKAGGTTQNYEAGFAKATLAEVAEDPATGTDLSSRLAVADGSWAGGIYTVNDPTAVFSRATLVDGPFDTPALKIGTQLSDPEDSLLVDLDLLGNRAKEIGSSKQRFGRLVLDPASGSERVDHTLPVRAEYWDGDAWRLHAADSSTLVSVANLSATQLSGPVAVVDVAVTGGGALAGGRQAFTLGAPNKTGILRYTLTAPAWLQFDWPIPSTTSLAENPSAPATFGVYEGLPGVIYQREVWAQ